MNFLKPENKQDLLTLQPLQNCNANLCWNAKVMNYRNAMVVCQNAIDLCRSVDPAHSIERSSSKVANGTGLPPLFCRRNDYVL